MYISNISLLSIIIISTISIGIIFIHVRGLENLFLVFLNVIHI